MHCFELFHNGTAAFHSTGLTGTVSQTNGYVAATSMR
jgi:hypothetical protein